MTEEQLETAWHQLTFQVARSRLYHERRQDFFEFWSRMTTASSLFFGTATGTALVADAGPKVVMYIAVLVTLSTIVDLVLGLQIKARDHADLRRRFAKVLQSLKSTEQKTEQQLMFLQHEKHGIEVEEGPILDVLNVICHNDVARSMGYDGTELAKISWYQRWFANVLDVNAHRLRKG